MNTQSGVFDWVAFPEGRARFCGGVRGADQAGHEAFAVEIGDRTHYGEISSVWPDERHFNLRVDSFGFSSVDQLGMPLSASSPFIEKFCPADVALIQSLIMKLVQTFQRRTERPFVMEMDDEDEFLGKVEFKERWVLVASEARPT